MFKVAIINIKEIGKILLKTIALFIIIFVPLQFIKRMTANRAESNSELNINYSLTKCFDICMPNINQNKIENKNDYAISKILDIELPIIVSKDEKQVEEKNQESQQEDTEIKEEESKTVVEDKYTNTYGDVNIKNETEFNLTEDILTPNIEFQNPKNVLIFHTHTCESYTPSDAFPYEMTGTYRTTDPDYNVIRVGKELTAFLKEKGFNVKHDTTYHDYPAYSGSYDRSYITVENDLKTLEDTEIVFDIHRDAIGDDSYAPVVKIEDEFAAQIMFVIGTNGGGLEHPNWIQNLKFAVKIQQIANEKYPGLFKPIILRNSRYNQNLAKAACIIEVGATGNTLEQCINSMKYLAEVLKEGS